MRELEYRGEDAPDELYDAAGRKADMIAGAVSALRETGGPVAPVHEAVEVPANAADIMPEPEPAPTLAVVPEPVPEYDSVTDVTETAVPASEPAPQPVNPRHESIFDAPEPQRVTEPEHEPATDAAPVDSQDTPVVNLRSMFTINDLFRFRRELFGNSEADMTDVFNMVMAMRGYEEAEDYFYGYLCWPPDNELVADFMNIVSHYFSNVR